MCGWNLEGPALRVPSQACHESARIPRPSCRVYPASTQEFMGPILLESWPCPTSWALPLQQGHGACPLQGLEVRVGTTISPISRRIPNFSMFCRMSKYRKQGFEGRNPESVCAAARAAQRPAGPTGARAFTVWQFESSGPSSWIVCPR